IGAGQNPFLPEIVIRRVPYLRDVVRRIRNAAVYLILFLPEATVRLPADFARRREFRGANRILIVWVEIRIERIEDRQRNRGDAPVGRNGLASRLAAGRTPRHLHLVVIVMDRVDLTSVMNQVADFRHESFDDLIYPMPRPEE